MVGCVHLQKAKGWELVPAASEEPSPHVQVDIEQEVIDLWPVVVRLCRHDDWLVDVDRVVDVALVVLDCHRADRADHRR